MLYPTIANFLATGSISLPAHNLRCALLTSAYTYSSEHTLWGNVSANECVGAGYTAGGKIIAHKVLAYFFS